MEKISQVQIATIIVNEKLAKETVLKMEDQELDRFYRESLNYIAQREHSVWRNEAFSHNYTLIKGEKRLREY